MPHEDIVLADLPKRECRNCKSFIRVRDVPTKSEKQTPYDRIVKCNGFCLLGQDEGHFGLFYNQTNPYCHSYCYDSYNAETNKMERVLIDWHNKLTKDVWDRRTKSYKMLDEFRKYLGDPKLFASIPTHTFGRPIHDKDIQNALYRMGDDRIICYVAELYLTTVARDQISTIYFRKSMPYKEYDRVKGYVRFKLAEAYENGLKPDENTSVTNVNTEHGE